MTSSSKIVSFSYLNPCHFNRNPIIKKEYETTLSDLLCENKFKPLKEKYGKSKGPYHLSLVSEKERLIFFISDSTEKQIGQIRLLARPIRKLVKDYYTICDSYYIAMKQSVSPQKIETLDMARRSVHNEAAEQLLHILESKVTIDFETTRRLFTLICVLHFQGHAL